MDHEIRVESICLHPTQFPKVFIKENRGKKGKERCDDGDGRVRVTERDWQVLLRRLKRRRKEP